MAKKLQKAKKGMNPKVKFTLVNAFKGFVSNQACIDGSKESPWWVAAIFLAFSVIIPLIPNFVNLSNASGSSFLSSYNYGVDTNMTSFAYNMAKQGVELRVSGGKLHYYEKDGGGEYVENQDKFYTLDDAYFENYYSDKEFQVINSVTHQIDARIFCLSDTGLRNIVNKLIKQYYKIGTKEKPSANPDPDEKYYLPNLVVFTPTTFAVALYKENSTKQAATSLGGLNWSNTSTKVGLIERLLGDGVDQVSSMSEGDFVNTYTASSFKQLKKICVETYLYQKEVTKWQTTGIYAAIYTGVILFLGLMMFILTRGKANPYKFLNVWHCQKIAWWAAASPAVIGTILSLIFSTSSIGQMAFILVVSLRIMWLSMKQLRPVYNQ